MRIHNTQSQTLLDVHYGNDFQLSGNDKVYPLFYEPVIIRGRIGGSALNTTDAGRMVWDAVSRLCYNKDPVGEGKIELLQGIYEIDGDKNDWQKSTKVRTGVDESGLLSFGLIASEDANPEEVKRLELIISTTLDQTAGILIVNDRQFQQFIELALTIQAFPKSQKVN